MLKTLKDLFDAFLPPQGGGAAGATGEHSLQLATAVLLVEVMRADPEVGAAERQAVLAALHEQFALTADENDRLLELAEDTARQATDFYAFTSRLNASLTMEQKLRIVEHMWRVAYADGTLGAHENHVLWRVSDLLHVPHGAYVSAKMRARDAAQAAGTAPRL